jgi:hypothetical protein
MYVVQEKKLKDHEDLTLRININPWAVSTGVRRMGNGGPHKDKRRSTKTAQRIKFKKELDY